MLIHLANLKTKRKPKDRLEQKIAFISGLKIHEIEKLKQEQAEKIPH